MPTIRCFVSYCHEGRDRDLVDYFVHLLQSAVADGPYEIVVDAGLPPGTALKEYMAGISTADAVLLLLSPQYKQRVLERRGGVYEEFKQLMIRYAVVADQRKAGVTAHEIKDYFEIHPILIAGDFETSVPKEIHDLSWESLTGLYVSRDQAGDFVIPASTRHRFLKPIQKLTERLKYLHAIRTKAFSESYRSVFKALFLDVKAPVPRADSQVYKYDKETFVETSAYRTIERQEAYFVVGRKGTGKSTAAGALAVRQKHKYKGHVSIIANDFNLEALYSLFNFDQVRSDARNVFKELDCFQLAWELFLFLCCMQIVVQKDDEKQLTEDQAKYVPPIRSRLQEIQSEHGNTLSEMEQNRFWFTFAFNRVIDFIRDCIDQARSNEQYFQADVQARFNRDRFLKFSLGENALASFEGILATCQKHFLVTLDGFDSAFDEFRRATMERSTDIENRSRFEIVWLTSLLRLILEIKEPHEVHEWAALYNLIECCITVPSDRLEEVKRSERDGFLYFKKDCHLDWSGIELCQLLLLRIEKSSGSKTDERKQPHERLQKALAHWMPSVPRELKFDFKERGMVVPLFLYVLRHTFWRPREILMHFAAIAALSEVMMRYEADVSSEAIRRAVAQTAEQVVKSEFIGELRSTILNIEEIVLAFSSKEQVLSYDRMRVILDNLSFRFASATASVKSLEEKIQCLYEIGFIGVKLSSQQQEAFYVGHAYAFYFNEGRRVLGSGQVSRLRELDYIVHPVFAEYLGLQRTEFVLDLTFNYLYQT